MNDRDKELARPYAHSGHTGAVQRSMLGECYCHNMALAGKDVREIQIKPVIRVARNESVGHPCDLKGPTTPFVADKRRAGEDPGRETHRHAP